jgi:hypothetical protein
MMIIFEVARNSSFGFFGSVFFGRQKTKCAICTVSFQIAPKGQKREGKNKINSFNLVVTFLRVIIFFHLVANGWQ